MAFIELGADIEFVSKMMADVLCEYGPVKKNSLLYFSQLLSAGVDLSLENRFGQNSLYGAVEANDIELTRFLIESGVSVVPSSEKSLNLLDVALLQYHSSSPEMVDLLLSSGISPDRYHISIQSWLKEKYGNSPTL